MNAKRTPWKKGSRVAPDRPTVFHDSPHKCWICGGSDHDGRPSADQVTPEGKPVLSADRDVWNATMHILFAALGPIKDRVPGMDSDSPEFLRDYEAVATAVGNYGGCIESKATRAAADVAVEAFFAALVEKMGPGTYQMEIGRRAGTPEPVRVH